MKHQVFCAAGICNIRSECVVIERDGNKICVKYQVSPTERDVMIRKKYNGDKEMI